MKFITSEADWPHNC